MKRLDVVFEGPDNTGKSTLIQELLTRIPHRSVITSEGPEKYPGEIDIRIKRYNDHRVPMIYDRHPAVSESIYAPIVRNERGPGMNARRLFYATDPLIIYCRALPGRGMDGHVDNAGVDTTDHVAGVTKHYNEICKRYDGWALRHAHMLYRIGDDTNQLLNAIVGVLRI